MDPGNELSHSVVEKAFFQVFASKTATGLRNVPNSVRNAIMPAVLGVDCD